MTIKKVKISELPKADSLKGVSTIGYSESAGSRSSVQVELDFVEAAAESANSAADNANSAADHANQAAEGIDEAVDNKLNVRLPLEGGEVGDLLTKGEGGANNWVKPSTLTANKADKLKVVELEREVSQLKNSLTQIGTGEAIGKATGGSVIDLPANVLDAVADVIVQGVTATNALNNSGFSNDLDGWAVRYADLIDNTDGVLTVKLKELAVANRIETHTYNFVAVAGHVYYVVGAIKVRGKSRVYIQVGMGDTSPSEDVVYSDDGWAEIKGIVTANTEDLFRLYAPTNNGEYEVGDTVKYKELMCVDLTARFGAGNEPTKEQCDLMFPYWFDGTKSVNTPMRVKSVGSNLCELGGKGFSILGKRLFDGSLIFNPGSGHYTFKVSLWAQSMYTNQAGAGGNRDVNLLPKLKNGVRYYFSYDKVSDGELTINLMNADGTPHSAHDRRTFVDVPASGDYYLDIRSLTNKQVVFKNIVISIDKKVEYSKYQESNLYIKTKAELESVETVSDFIKDGKLYKSVKDGAVVDTEITPIHTSGQVVAHPNGSIYFEPIATVAGRYSNKMEVADKTLPLLKLDKISKIDFETGVGTELDISKAVITTNSAFTHPELKSGDIVHFEYYYDESPIYGLNEVGYYNSNVVFEDEDKPGDFYRVVNKVKSGVLKQELIKIE